MGFIFLQLPLCPEEGSRPQPIGLHPAVVWQLEVSLGTLRFRMDRVWTPGFVCVTCFLIFLELLRSNPGLGLTDSCSVVSQEALPFFHC